MSSRPLLLAALFAALVTSAVAKTQEAPPACTAPAALPPEFSGWSQRSAVTAASSAAGLSGARLTPGKAVDAALQPTAAIRYSAPPEKPGSAASHGGLFAFTVMAPGIYRVALGSGAWLDVLAGSKAVTASAHGHGPECSGIRKMVDFPLMPGPHVLQIAASASPAAALLITRLP